MLEKERIPFTPEQLKSLCSEYRKGASLESLSTKYGISVVAIRSRLASRGVDIRSRGAPAGARSAAKKREVLDLLMLGKTMREIAAALSITLRTAYRRLEK